MRAWWSDARHFQIVALATLLAVNFVWIDFGARPLQSAFAIAGALATQAVCARLFRAAHRPALGADHRLVLEPAVARERAWLPGLAGVIAIASKFLLRIDGKHI